MGFQNIETPKSSLLSTFAPLRALMAPGAGSPTLPPVMSSPPTITPRTAFGNPTISSPKYIDLSTSLEAAASVGATSLSLRSKVANGYYRIGSETVQITATSGSSYPYTATLASALAGSYSTGAEVLSTAVRFGGAARRGRTISGNAPADFGYTFGSLTGQSGGVSIAWQIIDFVTEAPTVELFLYTGARFQMLVDGERAVDGGLAFDYQNGQRYWVTISFGTRKPRRIHLAGNFQLARIALDAYATITPGPQPLGPRVGVICDSYGQQNSPSLRYGGPFIDALTRLGWYDVALSTVGGTGFLNNNTNWSTFRDRIQADILDYNPDIVWVAGGINDQGRQTKATLQAECLTLFQQIRTALPRAWIVADSVWSPGGNATTANYIDVRDAVRDSLATITGPWLFIDNLTGSWSASDGRSTAPVGPVQTGTGKGPIPAPSIVVQSTAASGGTFSAATYYWVATTTTASGESTPSEVVASAAVGANGTATLSLGSMSGGTGAKVYRGTSAGGPFDTYVGTASLGGTLTDTGGGTGATPPPSTNGTATTTGNGNSDYYQADSTHPSRDGSAFLGGIRAEILAHALRAGR